MHDKAGGFVEQSADPLEHTRVPAKALANQLAGEAKSYKRKVLEDGILPRQDRTESCVHILLVLHPDKRLPN